MAAIHVAKEAGTAPDIRSFKVHHAMCTELMRLVDRISSIFPEIEEARNRSSTGIQALCMLCRAIEKANLLLQYCSESSKLYLAVTGDLILSRFTKSRSLLEQSLQGLEWMVPLALAVEISQLIDDLSAATFVLDPHEEEAGKVIRELLQKGRSPSDSMENSELKALQLAASRLKITTPMSILIERRAIKKLLDKVSENDNTKKNILTYFLYLFKKYGNLIIPDQTESSPARYQGSFVLEKDVSVNGQSGEVEPYIGDEQHEVESDKLGRAVPPQEFRCPISYRLMYDPVVIDSGKTYERMWIQRWFDEGNDTCPLTKIKVNRNNLLPNDCMKDLISKWCAKYKVKISDPSMEAKDLRECETDFTSTSSFGSSMNDLKIDFSNISLGSADASRNSNSSCTSIADGSSMIQADDAGSENDHSYVDISGTDLKFLSKLGELCWESQRKVVHDIKNHLKYNDKAHHSPSSENFVELLISFLRGARDSNDIKAQRDGFQLLLTFVKENRIGVLFLHEDAFGLLASFLDSEVTAEVFTVMEILSSYPSCRPKIAKSGALAFIKALDSLPGDFREQALNILCNLSSNHEICSQISSFECISKLVFLLCHDTSVRNCLRVMKNLCNAEGARASVAETSRCIASIAKVLDNGSSEEQEYAVDILLSLCSQHIEYCELLMEEGIVPSLVSISVNGTGRGKMSAVELLRLLRDIKDEQERTAIDLDAARGSSNQKSEKKSPKSSRFFRSVDNRSAEMEPRIRYNQYVGQSNMLRRSVPPEEFRCPISSRLMYDPVVIASGQSYERMWIQRWFDEGHDTCPKTNIKLSHMSLTPNIGMKELISRWCEQNGVAVSDPRMETEALHSWDTTTTSIAGLGSSMNDLHLPMDFSNISLGSLDASFSSDCSCTEGDIGLSSVQTNDSSDSFQSCADIAETDLEFLSKLGELSWEPRCNFVEDVKGHLNCDDNACYSLSSENFVEPLVPFLRDATNVHTFKVHHLICTELKKLVDRISKILPEIEAARSWCSTGIQALCTLNRAIEKANLHLQDCSESSKLYLAVTGDVILSRFTKSRNLLEQSLSQVCDNVPLMLSVEISKIVEDLKATTFVLDPYEDEAGKVIRELLQKGPSASDSMENSEVKAFQFAASRLQITSPKSMLIERRAIKKLLDKVGENDNTKKKILTYFSYMFKKYGSFIIPDQTEGSPAFYQGSSLRSSGCGSANNQSAEMEPHAGYGIQSNMLTRAVPPEEFRCPISSKLMYDPVVVASGQSYERMWIQRWFDEGHDTCPKTNIKLSHVSLTPNIGMKELISRWCEQNGVVVSDPRMETEALHS